VTSWHVVARYRGGGLPESPDGSSAAQDAPIVSKCVPPCRAFVACPPTHQHEYTCPSSHPRTRTRCLAWSPGAKRQRHMARRSGSRAMPGGAGGVVSTSTAAMRSSGQKCSCEKARRASGNPAGTVVHPARRGSTANCDSDAKSRPTKCCDGSDGDDGMGAVDASHGPSRTHWLALTSVAPRILTCEFDGSVKPLSVRAPSTGSE
jgi:hypothetical protein